jgi:hypothetical protein
MILGYIISVVATSILAHFALGEYGLWRRRWSLRMATAFVIVCGWAFIWGFDVATVFAMTAGAATTGAILHAIDATLEELGKNEKANELIGRINRLIGVVDGTAGGSGHTETGNDAGNDKPHR